MKENLKDLKTNIIAIVLAMLTLMCAVDDLPFVEKFRTVFIVAGLVSFVLMLLFARSEIPQNLDKFVDLFSNGQVKDGAGTKKSDPQTTFPMDSELDTIKRTSQLSSPKSGFLRRLGTRIKFTLMFSLMCGNASSQSHINPRHEWYSTFSAAIQYDFNTATNGTGRTGNQPGMASVAYFVPGFVSRSSKVGLIHVDQVSSVRSFPSNMYLEKYSILWPAVETKQTSFRPVFLGISRTGFNDPSVPNIMFRHTDISSGTGIFDPMPLSNPMLTANQIMTVQGKLDLSLTLPIDFGAIVERLRFNFSDTDPRLPLDVGYVQIFRSEPLVKTGDNSIVSPACNAALRMREGWGKLDLNSFSNVWRLPDTISSDRSNHFDGKNQYNSLLVTSNTGLKTPLKIDRNDISNVATEIVLMVENWTPINNIYGKFYQFDLVAYKTTEGVPVSLGVRNVIGNFNTLTQNSSYLNAKLLFSMDSYSQDILILTSCMFDRETFKPSTTGSILQVSDMAYPWGLSVTHTGVVSSLEPKFSLSPKGALTKYAADQFTRNFIWTLAD